MEKISFGDKLSNDVLNVDWWEIASPDDIVGIQLFVKESICPSEVLHEALAEVLGRPVGEEELNNNYDAICKEFLGECSAPSEKDIEKRFWPIVLKIVVVTVRLTLYNLALYPSFLVLSLLMVFAAIAGNASLLGCCTSLVKNYTSDYEDLREKHKGGYKKLGYALESMEMARNYNRLIWSVIL